jgi:hypothetical protein
MKICGLALSLFLIVIGPVTAEEPTIVPLSEEPLHFRLEVGVQPGHIVSGWLDESKGTGTGFDMAVLDLDGDGRYETKQSFGTQLNYTTKKQVPKPVVTIEHEDATWVFDLNSLGFRRPYLKAGTYSAYMKWSVTKGDFYAWFINGRTTLTTDRMTAQKAPPIRLGPPFSFTAAGATKGAEALLRFGVKDGNGCTMRLARVGKVQRRPEVVLSAEGKEVEKATATYG